MAVAVGAAVLSMIAITADNIRPVSPPAVAQLQPQQPGVLQPAVQPTDERPAVREPLLAGRSTNLDACGRPVVSWRAACR